jgi:hypothetical protein
MPTPSTAPQRTECNPTPLLFPSLERRKVVADFSGGYLSSDGGVLLLRSVDRALGLTAKLAQAFTDGRDERYCDHSVRELLAQRLYAMALGYEDLNDHTRLRQDPLLAVACEKAEPLGSDRKQGRQRGAALAGAATLNRLERGHHGDRYHKIQPDGQQVQDTLLELGVRCLDAHGGEIVIDLDSMGHLVHGLQEGRYFMRYYDGYCLVPLYAFVGPVPLWAQLRPGDCDAGLDGVVGALEAMVGAIRRRCKQAQIIVRADSDFAREETMAWCEVHGVQYCFGLGRNVRLDAELVDALAQARARRCLSGAPSARVFKDLVYQTRWSWSRARRVVGKAEVMAAGDNPRFVVTNLPPESYPAQALYEEFYCGRGEMENVLKQQVLDLPGDRMSAQELASNQLRLWLATLAYLLLQRLQSVYLRGTELARATVGTIRGRLLKVAASVQVSVRRVYVQLSSAFPLAGLFALCVQRLHSDGVT